MARAVEVLFLDGPLAGRTRTIPTWQDGTPGPEFHVAQQVAPIDWSGDEHDLLAPHRTHTYRIKPNRLSYGPRWCGAIGAKVGEQVVCVQPLDRRAVEAIGPADVDALVASQADEALARTCAAEGLVAAEVHEVWRGTRTEAREVMVRNPSEFGPMQARAAADQLDGSGSDPWLDGMVFVVHEAVAMPAEAVPA
ncbi:hypothetical protein SEA_XIMENITA_94 [Mycobacterium phage Ximenita]|uniref:Uncharacterized protein n=1 Tax=Mycobacterium phage Ximenita TaxID=2708633 RepID=A0A6G6XRZ7_9CAUD|nr:hypothetical protein I5G82_gp013 [Mycobacterium phage Ximenita]QIG61602.1 hypothetical protein SEA_XIMENITA_94 [Mycobacterium phage Ximenita]